MGQTHSISGLKWKPDSERFLPSTIRKRNKPFDHQSVSFDTSPRRMLLRPQTQQ
ncbi:predicted protein [Escherichia coli FVEC1412]|nr:predicted protein [Escherichia coli FVEC1412]EFJ73075.1 hypothetical protein HMPREF9552_03315 [Escherichia coli MS 198-1]ESD48449.1 hypothetical protein HMPREF1606_04953 [Escherichia coli 908522]KDU05083.1 hypothetical protein AB46_1172 [Escherichia coli 3-267-03_S1_C2]KXH00642.1 hypothetical protein HMPREF3040_01550 [Escherichia coli]